MTGRVSGGPVLVTGVTGFVGGLLAPRLLGHGYSVRGLTRGGNVDPALVEAGLDVRSGDVLSGEGLDAALAGVRVAYYLVHSMGGGAGEFEDRDARAARTFLAAAERAGVERIVYLGGLGEPSADLSPHLASRQEVGRILASGTPAATILNAAIIVGPGSASTRMIADLVRRLPVMITPRWVAQRVQPVYVGDVLEVLVGVLDHSATAGRSFDLGGPDVLTYRGMMIEYAHAMGRRRWIVTVPVLTPSLSSHWVGLVTSVDRALARALIEGLRNEVVARDTSILEHVPIEPTPYRHAIGATLDGLSSYADARRVAPEVPGSEVTFLDPDVADDRYGLPHPAGPEDTPVGGVPFVELRAIRVAAPPERVFARLARIGGAEGWYAAGWLWRLRGAMDRLVGGPGLRRAVPREPIPRPGDPLDFWRVVRAEGGDLLLEAEMRLPGRAWLGLHVRPADPGESVLFQRVTFHPRGALGRAYWWALYPIHQFLFRRMLYNLARAAETKTPPGP